MNSTIDHKTTSTFDKQTAVFGIIASLEPDHDLRRKINSAVHDAVADMRKDDPSLPVPSEGLIDRAIQARSESPDLFKPGGSMDKLGTQAIITMALEVVKTTLSPSGSATGAQQNKSSDTLNKLNQALEGKPGATAATDRAASPTFIRRIATLMGKPPGEIAKIEAGYAALSTEEERADYVSKLAIATPPAKSAGPKKTSGQIIADLYAALGKPVPAGMRPKPPGPATVTREQFDRMSVTQQNAHFRAGGRMID